MDGCHRLCDLGAFRDAVLPRTTNRGWTIAAEMMFYLSFPILVMRINSFQRALVLFVIACVQALTLNSIATGILSGDPVLLSEFVYEWLPNQMPIFTSGFVLYFLILRYAARTSRLLAFVCFGLGIGGLFVLTAAGW